MAVSFAPLPKINQHKHVAFATLQRSANWWNPKALSCI